MIRTLGESYERDELIECSLCTIGTLPAPGELEESGVPNLAFTEGL